MLAHTFAGTTIRSMLGLESERAVFERFRAARRSERDYVRVEAPVFPPASSADGLQTVS
jgi:hypothetical protein